MPVATDVSTKTTIPVALYSSQQIYAMEQAWFGAGHDSFGLMQQAAWQMAHYIVVLYEQKMLNPHSSALTNTDNRNNCSPRVSIWVGKGNNGGDGWLIAYYLQQIGWQVQIITVGFDKQVFAIAETTQSSNKEASLSDANQALQIALSANCDYLRFEDISSDDKQNVSEQLQADVYVDALFGIGLDRAPDGIYKQAINSLNDAAQYNGALVIAVDVPSGLVASTGQVFDQVAVNADATLCLIARKFGLHTNDGMDYSGQVIDIPLIPYQMASKEFKPIAKLLTAAYPLNPRRQNSYKGSYGHVLVIGGNRVDSSQGMGDVLSGVIAGLLAQKDLTEEARSLHQAVLLHGLAGDCLAGQAENLESLSHTHNCRSLLIGQRGLQAQDMPVAIRHIMHLITD